LDIVQRIEAASVMQATPLRTATETPDPEIQQMTGQIERALRRLDGQLSGRVSLPREDGYAAATAIWAKPVGPCRAPSSPAE
jgi:hypothetical protein